MEIVTLATKKNICAKFCKIDYNIEQAKKQTTTDFQCTMNENGDPSRSDVKHGRTTNNVSTIRIINTDLYGTNKDYFTLPDNTGHKEK